MKADTAVVLLSHGSLLCGSGSALQAHAERMRRSGNYVAIEPGYLNYCDPPIEIAVQRCADAGAVTVVIVPYFLVAGKFVLESLPRRLDKVAHQFPLLNFSLARALEGNSSMILAVEEVAAAPHDPLQWQTTAIQATRERCELRTECPLYGTAACRTATHG